MSTAHHSMNSVGEIIISDIKQSPDSILQCRVRVSQSHQLFSPFLSVCLATEFAIYNKVLDFNQGGGGGVRG